MFTEITDPITKQKLSLFSSEGRKLLKNYIKLFKSGGDAQEDAQRKRNIRNIYKKTYDIFLEYLDLFDDERYEIMRNAVRRVTSERHYIRKTKIMMAIIKTDDSFFNKLQDELLGRVGKKGRRSGGMSDINIFKDYLRTDTATKKHAEEAINKIKDLSNEMTRNHINMLLNGLAATTKRSKKN